MDLVCFFKGHDWDLASDVIHWEDALGVHHYHYVFKCKICRKRKRKYLRVHESNSD